MASIRCAHCKATHGSVADVRSCAGTPGVQTYLAPVAVLDRPKSLQDELRELRDATPVGRYAIINAYGNAEFYSVSKPEDGRWKGYTFLSRQAGDDEYPVKAMTAQRDVLAVIALDPKAASAQYGHLIGHCGVCGRTLTNPESLERGIGPVCADKMGW